MTLTFQQYEWLKVLVEAQKRTEHEPFFEFTPRQLYKVIGSSYEEAVRASEFLKMTQKVGADYWRLQDERILDHLYEIRNQLLDLEDTCGVLSPENQARLADANKEIAIVHRRTVERERARDPAVDRLQKLTQEVLEAITQKP